MQICVFSWLSWHKCQWICLLYVVVICGQSWPQVLPQKLHILHRFAKVPQVYAHKIADQDDLYFFKWQSNELRPTWTYFKKQENLKDVQICMCSWCKKDGQRRVSTYNVWQYKMRIFIQCWPTEATFKYLDRIQHQVGTCKVIKDVAF